MENPDPEPRGVSLKSSDSKDWLINFKRPTADLSSDPGSAPRHTSLSSDHSIENPPVFQQEPHATSLSSDRSIENPPVFQQEPCHTSLSSDRSIENPPVFQQEPCHTSLSSDRSIENPPVFQQEPHATSLSSDRSIENPPVFQQEPCHTSLSSDRSIENPPVFQQEPCQRKKGADNCTGAEHQNELDSIFKRLEEDMLMFIKQQLRGFLRLLASEHPESSLESEEEPSSREAVLSITLDFLRRMDLDELAQNLQNKAECGKLKSHLQHKFHYLFEGVAQAGNPTPLNQIYTELYITRGEASEVNQEHEVRHIKSVIWKPQEITIACEDIFKGPVDKQQPIKTELTKGHEPGKSKLNQIPPTPGPIKTTEERDRERPIAAERTTTPLGPRSKAISKLTNKFTFKKSNRPIRVVLTKGVAGVGKTVLTQKFSLDWAEGRANQDFQLLFPFTFRELNVLKDRSFSLVELLRHFFSQTKGVRSFQQRQLLFIFDGLDECRLPLDFTQTKALTEPTERASVEELLVNLIRGSLLPSARLWVTTRPVAANQIPAECVSMVTEVRGFTDPQKEQYFRKRFRDEEHATAVISHIKSIRSLFIMCYVPVFCWIIATVLEHLFRTKATDKLPRNLTQMYIHFLVVQAKVKNIKYHEGTGADLHWTPETREMVRSLGKLAFEQLQKGNLIFYERDLSECGLDAEEIARYSGVFTQVFREEPGLYQDKVYCFIHLSVQEFLAALHIHETFFSSGENLLSPSDSSQSPETFYRTAVDQACKSPNGHLDLFLRFLLGLSLSPNQSLLKGLLTETGNETQSTEETIKHIKVTLLSLHCSEENSLNLFHCLNELNDHSLVEQIQEYMRDGDISQYNLSPVHFSALCVLIQSTYSDLQEFDLRKYCPSEGVLLQLLPAVKDFTKAILSGCGLSPLSCDHLASALSSSSLTHLDLSNNNLWDSGVNLLCEALKSAPCRLETLSLSSCNLTEDICAPLASVLRSSRLKHLDVSNNDLQDSGVELLCEGLESARCSLDTFRLSCCGLSHLSCAPLASVLRSSSLKHLDVSNNDLQDSGVELLSEGLENAPCSLETLRLSGCLISERGGASLASTLSSAHSHVRELDLSYNHPGSSAELLTALRAPQGPLQTLSHCERKKEFTSPIGVGVFLSVDCCELVLDPNSAHGELCLSEDGQTVTREDRDLPYPHHEHRFRDYPQVLTSSGLRGRCYWEVEWSGDWGEVHIAASYSGISRRGASRDVLFGRNSQSWSLWVFKQGYCLCHNNKTTDHRPLSPGRAGHSGGKRKCKGKGSLTLAKGKGALPCGRVGVFLDSEAGTLSFFEVLSDGGLSHLHTVSCSSTEPLFPGISLGSYRSTASLVMTHRNIKCE